MHAPRTGRLFLLAACLLGCESSVVDPAVTGRSLLAGEVTADVLAAVDALPAEQEEAVYEAVALWSDVNPSLTGTVDRAADALAVVVRHPDLGADALYRIVAGLAPDPGQGFVVAFGETVSSSDGTAAARADDALTALEAALARPDSTLVASSSLGPEISSLAEFHGLRILDPAAMPTAKRGGLQDVRLRVPAPTSGDSVRKVIKVGDIDRYLSGAFDPEVGGFAALTSQTGSLVGPADVIEGLRLDYPGGFAGQTEVGELRFPRTADIDLFVPFAPSMGGLIDGDYPFTGTGFTGTVRARAVPELHMPLGPRTPLPHGTRMVHVLSDGRRLLRATLDGQGVWVTPGGQRVRQPGRTPVRRMAVHRGVPVWISSTDGVHFFAAHYGPRLPAGLLQDPVRVGRWEHLGKIAIGDLRLE